MQIGICDDSIEDCAALAATVRSSPSGERNPRMYTRAEQILADPSPPELLFLDVELLGMDGLAAARALRDRGVDMQIVFVSGHPEYVFDAFDVEACGYLVKPFDEKRVEDVLRRVRQKIESKGAEPRLVISRRGEHMSVRLRDIIYAEVFNRKIVLHTTSGTLEYYGKLAELQAQAGADFYRTHRAYLVNFRYVDGYDAHSVRLAGHEVLMAKKSYSAFVSAYMDYIDRVGRQQ